MANCYNCDELVEGESGACPDNPEWEFWYINGDEYTCYNCGAVNLAHCDGESVRLTEVENEDD